MSKILFTDIGLREKTGTVITAKTRGEAYGYPTWLPRGSSQAQGGGPTLSLADLWS